jgi:hypothetical protein
MNRTYRGLFVAEGTSDMPLAELVESLFFDRGIEVTISRPDFGLLGRVSKDVQSKYMREILLPKDRLISLRYIGMQTTLEQEQGGRKSKMPSLHSR